MLKAASKRMAIAGSIAAALALVVVILSLKKWRSTVDYLIVPRLVTTSGESEILDPSQLYLLSPYQTIHNITRQIIVLGRDGEYKKSNLLSEFRVFENNMGIRGVMSSSAKYSDGSPILARDVLKTFQRLLITGSSHTTPKEIIKCDAPVNSMDDQCSGLVEVDERTFELNFRKPVKDIYYYLQMADWSVLHKSQYQKLEKLTLKDWGITSGYYTLSQIPSGELMLNVNPFAVENGMIQKILFKKVRSDKEYQDGIVNGEYHLGGVTFKHYKSLSKVKNAFDHYNLIVDRHANVIGLVLNTKSSIFQDEKTRQWVYRRIIENFKAPKEYSEIAEKALQFFLPSAPGRLSETDIQSEVKKFDISEEVPETLKDGIRIRSAQNLANLFPIEIMDELKRVLSPVKIEYTDDVESKDYVKFKKNREFDIMLIATSMSYKEPSESLNLAFTSDAPTLTDPSGLIRKTVIESHETLDEKKSLELTQRALLQMVRDAEFVPLLYVGKFYFSHKEYLDDSEVHFWESTQYHSFRMK